MDENHIDHLESRNLEDDVKEISNDVTLP